MNKCVTMTLEYCKLCSVLLLEHFGPIVQTVGENLLKYDRRTLGSIRSGVKLPLNKVGSTIQNKLSIIRRLVITQLNTHFFLG